MGRYKKIRQLLHAALILSGILAVYWIFFPPLQEYDRIWKFDSGQLESVYIQTDYNVQIECKESEDGTNYIEIKGSADKQVVNVLEGADIVQKALTLNLSKPGSLEKLADKASRNDDTQYITFVLAREAALHKIEASSTSEWLRIRQMKADHAVFKTTSGQVKLDGYKGESLNIQTGSGDIEAFKARGKVEAVSEGGNIKLIDMEGNPDVQTNSGNFQLSGDLSLASVQTVSGNITIAIPAGYQSRYDLQTNTGKIRAPRSITSSSNYIKVKTNSGNIRINPG
ncbi:DUF4097 family beta strand repeat-containing protein [Paenibacillus larvae]